MLDALRIHDMDHSEALQQMAAERYLLNELTPDAREAFEEHLFDCQECALDLRAGVAFIDEAKAQLPNLTQAMPAPQPVRQPKVKREWWLGWLQPAFAMPAFAALLLVVGYQNLVTLPGLRASADQPRLLPWTPLRGETRGAHLAINADRQLGVALPVELPQQPSAGSYASFSFDLVDPQGKLVWTGAVAAPADEASDCQRLSLMIPGGMLRNGAYSLTVSGVAAQGERTKIDEYFFDLHFSN